MRTIIATLLFLLSVPLLATPSTLVQIPSTDIQPQGVWHLGVDSYAFTNGSSPDYQHAFIDTGLTYGVTPRLELGIDMVTGQRNPLWLNGKYLIVSPQQSPVALAIGVFNAATDTATNQSVSYLVGSGCIEGTRLTAGGYIGNNSVLGEHQSDGIMVGLDRTLGKWWLGLDYFSGKNAIGSVNAGVGYSFTDKISAIVGYDHFNNVDINGTANALNFQLDVNL